MNLLKAVHEEILGLLWDDGFNGAAQMFFRFVRLAFLGRHIRAVTIEKVLHQPEIELVRLDNFRLDTNVSKSYIGAIEIDALINH